MKLFDKLVFADWDQIINNAQSEAEIVETKISDYKSELKRIVKSVDSELLTESEGKEQAQEVRKNILLAEIVRSDIRIEQYNKEIVREFTEHFLLNLDKLWGILDLTKRQALLAKILPSGITCDKKRYFRTLELSPSFALIQSLSERNSENVTL